MGIPAYFKYVKDKVKPSILNERPSNVTRLFLDFNGIIHGSKEEVFNDGGNEKDIYIKVLSYIKYIVSEINPSELLYISIDGVAPRAKMEQQRKRRYKSIQDRYVEASMKKTEIRKWDSNAISPGTRFMSGMDQTLYESKYLKELSESIDVIISNSTTPGEGEQKMFRHIRKCESGVNVIHGLDADLIMLSILQCDKRKIYLYREYDKKPHFININMFLDCLKKRHSNLLETDYVFLSFLMGNDFLPHFYALYMRIGNLDVVLNKYDEIRNKLNESLIIDNEINKNFLYELIFELSESEDKLVSERVNKMVYKRLMRHGNSGADRFDYWPDYNRNKEVEIDFGNDGWRERYYDEIECSDCIEDMCKEYVQGLLWNLNYYTADDATLINQSWYYPYLHAPLLKDVAEYIKTNDIGYKLNNRRYNSLEQLAIILPVQSSHLLPKSWQNAIRSNVSMYPKKFKLDPIGSVFRWECAPILENYNEDFLKKLNKKELKWYEEKRKRTHSEYLVCK